ncbi:uncharacterized protein BX663DRAFT_478497 [Cokeromyces recurvatus]|uniref:uncharacterized protein n=1 Tax=Cokeromyces recurvatus TaxID=90255 RepID=UPI00221E6D7B|nr:uncharacterized protein BX663DRAFT_478497 [Cokeromyces recurvatus]KAI7899534.1 hypothetical protein BX663DRAFT_478497 [Cokeromyces recurvatus]
MTPNTPLSKRLSLPDLQKLKEEWDRREAIQTTSNQIPPGKLQIDLLNVRSDVPVKRPFIRLRMGSQHYFSSKSKDPNGNWNEGFLFTISYHNQLFDTIELDLYDKGKTWRSKTKHIGKAKLKIAKLKNRDDVFITFIPMYEYHVKRYLPAHIQLPHTFLKSHIPNMSRYYHHKIRKDHTPITPNEEDDIPPPYQLHPSHSQHSMTPYIGSIQVRIRYSFQYPQEDSNHSDTLSAFHFNPILSSTTSSSSFLTTSTSRKSSSCRTTSHAVSSNSSDISCSTADECEGYHDAVEPHLILVDHLTTASPTTPKPTKTNVIPEETVENLFQQRIDLDQHHISFPRTDVETKKKKKGGDMESDTASIKSHNFGDKNFAFRWMNETFDEVAISHPSLDRMIGMVVSQQTRILLRAVVKIFNAFGQGFKITILQLISSLSLLQQFYADIPRAPPAEKVTDLKFLDEAYYFLGHAIIAYGWRGISYLGDYAKYLKDVMKTKSNKEAIVRYLKIPQKDLLGYEYGLRKGAVFQPSYFISYDQAHEAVVLGIRGTWSLYDCITDLVCEYRPWKGGLVHAGMLASAQWLFTTIIPQIYLYVSEQTERNKRRISSFIITGHSLGAGTAAILTMMVVEHLDQLRELSQNPHFRVHCYSYAPVASVSHDLSERYSDYIDSFVCHDDLVARLSYGTASCAKELIMDSLIAVDGLGGTTKVTTNAKTRKECFNIIQTRRKEIYHGKEPRYPLLYVPGTVYQFRRASNQKRPIEKQQQQQQRRFPIPPFSSQSEPVLSTTQHKEDPSFSLHRSSPMISEEVLISKTCLEDHMVVTYLTAFQTVRQDCMRQRQKAESVISI